GTGNLKLFNPPKLIAPSAFEVYEPEFKDRVSTTQSGMRGSISESYTIIPQFQGEYTIDPLSFSYFDPDTQTYKTITSDQILIQVEGGPVAGKTSSSPQGAYRHRVVQATEQFNYITLKPNLVAINQSAFFKSPVFWSLFTGPFLLIPLVIFFSKKQKELESDITGQRLKKANKLAKKYLSEAKKNQTDQSLFYDSL